MILLKNRDRNPSFKKGEYVEINDAGNYPMELSVDGVCEQETTTGKNLLPNNATSQTINEINYTVNSDGSVYVKGTATARSEFTICDKPFTLNANTEYKFQTDILMILRTSTGYISRGKGETFTSESEISVLKVYIRVENGTTIDKTIYPMITLSNQNDTYEPYTGGQPSPSPDFPSPIESITEISATVTGKNLLNPNGVSKIESDLTFTNNGNGIFTVSGTSTTNRSFSLSTQQIELNANQPYTQSITTVSGTKTGEVVVGVKNSSDEITFNYIAGNQTITPTEDLTTHTYTYYVASGKTVNWTFKVQLEKGTQITEYEEYKSNSLTIDLQGNELCSLPNGTKDEVNITNGEVLLIKRIGKVVLDGSEEWGVTTGLHDSYMRFGYNAPAIKAQNRALSNYFKIGNTTSTSVTNLLEYRDTNHIFINTNVAENLSGFKTWLSTHNVEVLYELAEPETINLGTVEMPHTYEGVSNITNSADTEMVVKYYKKFEFDKILRSGYNIDEQEYEIAKKQMANGKRKKILSSYVDCIIKIDLGLLDNKTYQEYKEQLEDGEYEYWSYKYNQYKKANFILTKPSITTEYAYDDEIGIDDMEITLEKSSDVS